MNKKTYISPEIEVIQAHMDQMICVSNEGGNVPGGLSKKHDFLEGEEEDRDFSNVNTGGRKSYSAFDAWEEN